MSIFSYLFENNRHQATFSTLPVVVGSSRLHKNQIKVRFFRPGRLASGEKSKRRIYLQKEPSSGSAQDTSWAKTRLGGLDYVWGPPSPTLATSLVVLVLLFLSWSCKQRSWLFWCWSWSCYFGLGLVILVLFTSLTPPSQGGRVVASP